jgi:hypothetical protein
MSDTARNNLVEMRGDLIPEPARTSSIDPEETTPWGQVASRSVDDADWRRFRSDMRSREVADSIGCAGKPG